MRDTKWNSRVLEFGSGLHFIMPIKNLDDYECSTLACLNFTDRKLYDIIDDYGNIKKEKDWLAEQLSEKSNLSQDEWKEKAKIEVKLQNMRERLERELSESYARHINHEYDGSVEFSEEGSKIWDYYIQLLSFDEMRSIIQAANCETHQFCEEYFRIIKIYQDADLLFLEPVIVLIAWLLKNKKEEFFNNYLTPWTFSKERIERIAKAFNIEL